MVDGIVFLIVLGAVVALAIITSTNDDRAVRRKSHGPVRLTPHSHRQYCHRRQRSRVWR